MEDGPLYFKDKKNNKKLKVSQCNFDQAKMREHLYKCFSGRRLLPFPENIATLIKNNIQSSTDDIAVHCYCRMPELKDVSI